ncbi:hypothetical protein Bpfe_005651 [Biomphalaria pfeifferi]|uniref:Uncharacterized protein n=1 Tax=Biomphalaria pfeifferi TaxID=112525 RepID=A0AAD8C3M8_BIOPF|nr:hypothetical protein Bpfe_005651 [Biomphalaria pfeifferi]
MGYLGGVAPLVDRQSYSVFEGSLAHSWSPRGPQLSPVAPRSCSMRSGHTPKTTLIGRLNQVEDIRRVHGTQYTVVQSNLACEVWTWRPVRNVTKLDKSDRKANTSTVLWSSQEQDKTHRKSLVIHFTKTCPRTS